MTFALQHIMAYIGITLLNQKLRFFISFFRYNLRVSTYIFKVLRCNENIGGFLDGLLDA